MRWPEGFMWGSGASSTQSEGASPASDWWSWERDGHAPLSGETNYYPFAAYLGLGWPPGHDDLAECARVSQAMQLATAEAAVRLKQTGAPVASIFGLSGIQTLDDTPETKRLAGLLDALNWQAGLGLFRDGILRVPSLDPVERPDLAGSFDLVGFSFYSTMGIRQGARVPYPSGAPVSPLGYGIWADGLGLVLDRLHQMLPGTPLLVAEYGIGTSDDAQRAAYLERGLQVTSDAIARGVDVRGLFHWTAVDNYEWLNGYKIQFGIIDQDRRIRPSAQVLKREATPADRPAG